MTPRHVDMQEKCMSCQALIFLKMDLNHLFLNLEKPHGIVYFPTPAPPPDVVENIYFLCVHLGPLVVLRTGPELEP